MVTIGSSSVLFRRNHGLPNFVPLFDRQHSNSYMEGIQCLIHERARTLHPTNVWQSWLQASHSYKYLKTSIRVLCPVVILQWPYVQGGRAVFPLSHFLQVFSFHRQADSTPPI